MQTTKFLCIVFFASMVFLQSGCKKEDECPDLRLPSATQTGQNTIGCLTDGVVMVPYRGMGWNVPPTRRFRYNQETGELFFDIMFYADEKDYECGYPRRLLVFSANEVFSEGSVETSKIYAKLRNTPDYLGVMDSYYFLEDFPDLSAQVIISRLDTVNNIISGTFDIEMHQNTGGLDDWDLENKFIVSQGRFDFHYRQDGGTLEGFSN